MSTREHRAQTLVDQIDDATAKLLSNQLKLVKLASNKNKSLVTMAAETAEIEASSSGIVRAVEDLLVISRGLKEAWVLGQINEPEPPLSTEVIEQREREVEALAKMLNSYSEWPKKQ